MLTKNSLLKIQNMSISNVIITLTKLKEKTLNKLQKTKSNFKREIRKIAKDNLLKKLEKQGKSYDKLSMDKFDELLEDEIEILKSDTKKVGVGIGIGFLISMLTGF